jgi:class 3 adenylate cyclase
MDAKLALRMVPFTGIMYAVSRLFRGLNRIERLHLNFRKMIRDENAIVCMIDLCNFSSWCDDKSSSVVFETMTKYNVFLKNLLGKFKDLEKVELVGDCVMVVGWISHNAKRSKLVVNQMIEFAMDMLTNIEKIQNIFEDDTISIRIGIHEGKISSGFISNPRKFQVFGRSVNLASRIEAAATKGTCWISNTTLKTNNIDYENIEAKGQGQHQFKGFKRVVSVSELSNLEGSRH